MNDGETSRACGTCSQCCKTLGIDELKKPPSAWCPNCKIAEGCQIYDTRPQSCRDFNCLWLTDSRLPDAMRPDKSKVVLHLEKKHRRLKVNVDPDRPDAWKKGLMAVYLAMVRRAGVNILIVCGEKRNLRRTYDCT